jgi:hypothetical protein
VQSLPAQGVQATTYQSIDELPHQSVVGSHSRQTADCRLDAEIAVCRNFGVKIGAIWYFVHHYNASLGS